MEEARREAGVRGGGGVGVAGMLSGVDTGSGRVEGGVEEGGGGGGRGRESGSGAVPSK